MDSLVNLFNSIIDSNTAKNQIKIAKANEQIQSLQKPVGNSNVIGFQTPNTIEYYDYDEDDDDDL